MSEKTVVNRIKPETLFNLLGIKDGHEEYEKVLAVAYSFLLYMKEGDSLVTATAVFNKISHDLIQIESSLSPEYITDELVGKRIIKFPL